MPLTSYPYLLLAASLPLFTFLLLLPLGKRIARFSGPLSATLAFASFALSVGALLLWVAKPGFNQPHAVEALSYHWITLPSPSLSLSSSLSSSFPQPQPPSALTLGILVDSLSVSLFLLITFLNTLVHCFALASTAGNPKAPRFFALLNLLAFSTLALLLSNSLPQLFIAWQLLALATWLLIHFHTDRRAPVTASLRMFLTNRIGDAAFLTGIGILLLHLPAAGLTFFDAQGASVLTESIRTALGVRSSEFLFFTGDHAAGALGLHWLTWACIAFLTAALIRAAQFPFFSWLVGTAEAPAPAATLIQTCTTLASAIFLLARLFPLLTLDARLILATVGCLSCFLAAAVACAQTDLRKLLAWTTLSQLGYVLLFLGSGAYMAGLLHLFTHAFIKAGLLLAAGAILHALQNTTDFRDIAPGLWKRLPITAAASLFAVLAFAGTPFLSASYSSNLGLACVYQYAAALRGPATTHYAPEMLLFWLPTLTLYLTAFAIGRWWWLTFVGNVATKPSERSQQLLDNARESALMTLPLILLAGFYVGLLYEFLGILQFIQKSLPPAVVPLSLHVPNTNADFQYIATLTALAPAGLLLPVLLHLPGITLAHRLRRLPGLRLLHLYLKEALYLQPFAEGLFVNAILLLSRATAFLDRFFLSATLRLLAFLTEALTYFIQTLDTVLDRPTARLALSITPLFRRLCPPPPPPPVPPSDTPAT